MISKTTRITLQNVGLLLAGLLVAVYAIGAILQPRIQSPVFRSMVSEIPWSGYCHIVPGAMALVLGAFLLSRRMRRKRLWLHKTLGYGYVLCVMISTVGSLVGNWVSPSSMQAKSAFYVLGILWPIVTLLGTPFDDMFDRKVHGQMMKVSYALTLSAVSLRIYIGSLLGLGYDFETAYPISAWASFTGNLLVLFLYSRVTAWLQARELAKMTSTL